MLIFNCTKAAQDFFTVIRKGEKQTIVEMPPCTDMSEDRNHLIGANGKPPQIQQWLLHAITIERKHCLVAMEMDTRFSVTITSLKKADADSFLQSFKILLSMQVMEFGQESGILDMTDAAIMVRNTLGHFEDIHLFRRSDRSAQAQLNKITGDLRYYAEDDPLLLTDEEMLLNFNYRCNNMIRSSKPRPNKNYIKPNEEMLLVWQQLYQGATPKQLAETRQRLSDHERSHMEAIMGGFTEAFTPPDNDDLPPPHSQSKAGIPEDGPLTNNEMNYLDNVLLKYKTDRSLENLSSLQGFLTAVVSGPNVIPTHVWLSEIWGPENNQPTWESEDEMLKFVETLIKMMNDISQTLMTNSQNYAAIFMGDQQNIDVSDWCFGYIAGYELDEAAWDEMPEHLSSQMEFLDECSFMVSVGGNNSASKSRKLNDKVITIAQDFHAYWLKQRSPQQRPDNVVELRPQHPATSQRVGRNEPCPCGSGKKFKKCCLH